MSGDVRSVAIVGNYASDPSRLDGGIEAVVDCLSAALADHCGLRIAIISPDSSAVRVRKRTRNGIDLFTLPVGKLRSLTLFGSTKKSIGEILEQINPDVVHCHDLSIETYAALASGLPCVVTVHGVWKENARYTNQNYFENFRTRIQSAICERSVAARRTGVICISPYIRSCYESVFPGEFFDISNPVPDRYFAIARKPEKLRILFAGRIVSRKGIHDLLHASAELRKSTRIRLVLAGRWDRSSYSAEVKELLASPPFPEFVEVKGLLSEDELVDEYARAAVLVLPSYQETSPMVIQQAMAAKLPIVATSVGGVGPLVGERYRHALVTPGDVLGLSQALGEALRYGDRVASAAAAAQQIAETQFRPKVVAEKTLRAYIAATA